ncbi:MAG: ATP-binding protein [Cyanobacteria bacterium J06641_5]
MELSDPSISPPPSSQRDREVLACLASLSHRSSDLRAYLQAIADGVSRLIGLDWSVVTFCEEDTETVLASSIDLGCDKDPTFNLHGTLTGTVFASGKTLAVPDVVSDPQHGNAPEGYRAYLGVPLRLPSGSTLGTICSFHGQPRAFGEDDIQVAELFAERAAIALDNYRLYEEQRARSLSLAEEVDRQTAALRATQNKLIERERLAAIGTFAASIVHELRNPTTTIKLVLGFFERRVSLNDDARHRLSLAVDEARRLEKLLGEILLYAKPHVLQREVVEFDRFVAQIATDFRDHPVACDCTVQFVGPDRSIWVEIDRDKFKQVVLNLLGNACEASTAGAIVTCRMTPQGDGVKLQVINGGEPIPPEILPRLTEPFFTTKAEGTGLGLSIVKRLVESHDGFFELTSSAATGTAATAWIPQATIDLPASERDSYP